MTTHTLLSIVCIVASLACTRCGGELQGIDVRGATDDEIALAIQPALDAWCAAGYCLDVIPGAADTLAVVDGPIERYPNAAGIHAEPTTLDPRHRIVIRRDTLAPVRDDARDMINITMHELGHRFGCRGHSGDPSDVMWPVASDVTELSARDIACAMRGR